MKFARRPHPLKPRLPERIVRTRSPGGVLLTFDDGPHPEHTPLVLDRLARHGLRAVFFLVGERVAKAPHIPRLIVDAGHVLGNHTHTHARRGWLDLAGAAADVDACQRVVPAATTFRPPYGRLTPGLWRAARRHGLACLNWSLDSGDWRCRSDGDAATCAAEVAAAVRPGDVVLFHDDHHRIGPILDVVLPRLAGTGG